MRFRIALPLAATALGLIALSTPAMALNSVLTSVAGTQFQPACISSPCASSPYDNSGIFYSGAEVMNDSGTSSLVVEVSLGHTSGGTHSWTVWGNGNGNTGTVLCSAIVVSSATGGTLQLGPAQGGAGANAFSMQISTSVSAVDAFYSLQCTLPAAVNGHNAAIVGVVANQ